MNRRSFIFGLGVASLSVTPLLSYAGNYLNTTRGNQRQELNLLLKNLNIILNDERFGKLLESLSSTQHTYVTKLNSLFAQQGDKAFRAIKGMDEIETFVIELATTCYLNKQLNHKHATNDIAPSYVRMINSKTHNFRAHCGGPTGFWTSAPLTK